VSGAGRGIGRAVAHELALKGASVVITARGREALESTAKEIAGVTGATVIPLTVDTNDNESVRSTFARSGLGARQTGSIVRSIRNVSVAALTKNLADELGEHGINVTVVHPGLTLTESIETRFVRQADDQGLEVAELGQRGANNAVGRPLTAQKVAWVVTFLPWRRSVAVTGDAIAAGGGAKDAIYY
jgi:NAD(P)-dependent dehydrogenase (short-subunit alcohol dehydrogenase family)